MGSASDWETLQHAAQMLERLDIVDELADMIEEARLEGVRGDFR